MADPQICCVEGCVNGAALDDPAFCAAHLKALSNGALIKIAVSRCTVAGCAEPPRSTFSSYCHMHDARLRRHGSVKRKPMDQVLIHSHGYRLILAQGHPMARGQRAYEHRVVYYDANPNGPEPCHWCKKPLTWSTLEVDHLNTVRDDNRLENLVASCGGCNRDRAKPAAVRAHKARAKVYTVNGKWLSIDDAARSLGINRTSVITRLKAGWSIERAFTEPRGRFGPKSLTA